MADVILYPPLAPPWRVTQLFGARPEVYRPLGYNGHPGVDLSCVVGTPIHAGLAGHMSVGQTYLSGIIARVHGALGTAVYSHLSATVGPSGRYVLPGQIVALSGNTGAHTEGPHLDIMFYPADADYNNGYRGAVDPWPMLEEGLMELEKAGELATALRWELEEAQREREKADDLFRQGAELEAEAHELERQADERIKRLLSMEGGLAHAVEAALGRPVPDAWHGSGQ
jgi:peptidoglycan LD-endopeptidase LytH